MYALSDYYVYAAFWRKFSLLSELPLLMLGNCFFHLRKKMRIVDSDKRHLSLSLLFWGFLLLLGQSLDKNQLFHLSDSSSCRNMVLFGRFRFVNL